MVSERILYRVRWMTVCKSYRRKEFRRQNFRKVSEMKYPSKLSYSHIQYLSGKIQYISNDVFKIVNLINYF